MVPAKVFVSSTMENLKSEREALRRLIDELGQVPILAENFGARIYSPKQACLDGVQQCDVFVLVLGERYGWITPDGVSVTETEFDSAVAHGKRILVYKKNFGRMHDDGQPNELDKYRRFLQRVADFDIGWCRDTFDTVFDLQAKVRKALVAATTVPVQPGDTPSTSPLLRASVVMTPAFQSTFALRFTGRTTLPKGRRTTSWEFLTYWWAYPRSKADDSQTCLRRTGFHWTPFVSRSFNTYDVSTQTKNGGLHRSLLLMHGGMRWRWRWTIPDGDFATVSTRTTFFSPCLRPDPFFWKAWGFHLTD